MNKLMYTLFILIFVFDFLVLRTKILHRVFSWAPEMVSAITLLVICVQVARNKVAIVPARYVIILSLFILFLCIGIISNQIQPGAIFSGLRKYFRYAPFFILPLVYRFSDVEISKIIKVLLFLSLIQLPVVIYQKLVVFKLVPTGDVIEGTIIGSGKLAVYLICAMAMVLAFYLKGRLSTSKLLIIMVILFLPVAITEATATFFLLPLAFVFPILFLSKDNGTTRSPVPIMMFGVVLFIGFITIYNLQYADRWGGNILNTIFSGKAADAIYKGATEDSTADNPEGEMAEIGRVDSMILPLKILSKKGVAVLIGTGIGNASPSFSNILRGDYSWAVDEYGADFTTISTLLWEVGIIGVIFSFVLLFMVFRDAIKLKKIANYPGVIALGWIGVLPVIILSMGYTNLLGHNVIGYLMWFFNGYIIANANAISLVNK